MTAIQARFYDGKTSGQREVLISAQAPARLRVTGAGVEFIWALTEVRASSRVGNSRRHLHFPDGSQCETEDNDAIDQLFAEVRAQAPGRLLHRWESRIGYVSGALVLTAALAWAGIAYGIPALAKQIAFRLPASTQEAIGRDTLAALDQVLLEPTKLGLGHQSRVMELFAGVAANIEGGRDYRLELRAGKRIGANALALPSGIIVVTDQLVDLAKNDGELIAILAHEMGHLKQRHALRGVLQSSALPLLFIVVTGDLSSVVSLAAALPTLLLHSKYSRDFEREADDFAFAYMKQQGIPTQFFADIMLRLERQRGASSDGLNYFSSHPATQERIERFRAAP